MSLKNKYLEAEALQYLWNLFSGYLCVKFSGVRMFVIKMDNEFRPSELS